MNDLAIRATDEQLASFEATLADVARQMGSVNAVSAAVACRTTFGTELTQWQQRSVNRALLPHRVRLEFCDPELPAG